MDKLQMWLQAGGNAAYEIMAEIAIESPLVSTAHIWPHRVNKDAVGTGKRFQESLRAKGSRKLT